MNAATIHTAAQAGQEPSYLDKQLSSSIHQWAAAKRPAVSCARLQWYVPLRGVLQGMHLMQLHTSMAARGT